MDKDIEDIKWYCPCGVSSVDSMPSVGIRLGDKALGPLVYVL